MTGSGRTRRRVLLMLILLSGLSSGCTLVGEYTGEYTGEDAATAELGRLQEKVVAVLTDWPRKDDPVDRVRQVGELSHPMQGPYAEPEYAVLVEPLVWRAGDRAVVEVRLRVDAAKYTSPAFSSRRSWDAGTAERCLRVVIGQSSVADVVVDTIDCAGRTARPVPPYVPPPPLDVAMLEKAMRRSSFSEAEQAANVAFPAPDFVVVGEVIDGTWVIVVVRRGEHECVGATRTIGGKIKAWFPDRRRMQPGEGGCDPVAFVRPI